MDTGRLVFPPLPAAAIAAGIHAGLKAVVPRVHPFCGVPVTPLPFILLYKSYCSEERMVCYNVHTDMFGS